MFKKENARGLSVLVVLAVLEVDVVGVITGVDVTVLVVVLFVFVAVVLIVFVAGGAIEASIGTATAIEGVDDAGGQKKVSPSEGETETELNTGVDEIDVVAVKGKVLDAFRSFGTFSFAILGSFRGFSFVILSSLSFIPPSLSFKRR